METEELGSVYEGLLELTPRASADARVFAFAEGDETRGHERKTTGSYYTPRRWKLLLDSTLDPVLDAAEARNLADPIAEILKLDPRSCLRLRPLPARRRAPGGRPHRQAQSPARRPRSSSSARCARSSPAASTASIATRSRSSCARWRSGSRRWSRASR